MAQANLTDEQTDFDQIIEKIGNAGPFQRRFNFIFNFIMVIVLAMPNMNLIISLAVPDHWCHVPGKEDTNYTSEQWKYLTIPMELNAYGILDYSKCTRFANVSSTDIVMRNKDGIIKCDRGWEYDHTWYDLTAPTQNDWVCDDEMVPTNVIAVCRAGDVIGSLVFAQLADNIGRMPVFFISLTSIIFGRVLSAFTSSWFYLFLISSFIGSLSSTSVFQAAFIITMEISRAEDRANIGFVGFMAWSLGFIILPLFLWLLRDWVYFILATTLPCAIFLISRPWFIESPRWLASKGRVKQCIKELEKIAKTNKTEMPGNIEAQLISINQQQSDAQTHTIISLFSSMRLARNTIVLVYCNSVLSLINVSLIINVSNLDTNPFLQYSFQGLVELPSYIIGKWGCNRFGRRWTIFFGFFLGIIGCILALIMVQNNSDDWIISIVCIFIHFCMSLVLFSVTLLNTEIYPTCIRQTGTSIGNVIGSLISILAPYIIALGVSINAMIPYLIYASLLLIATLCCLFLPETQGKKLPETLNDASIFGANQDIWGRDKPQ